MDQKWITILVTLMFYQTVTSGADIELPTQEGQQVDIKCQLQLSSMVIWFRVLDKTGMEFIASFSNSGILKSSSSHFSQIFSSIKMPQQVLTLKSFNKDRDSGIYSCASLYKGNELKFGQVTRLFGDKNKDTAALPSHTTPRNVPATTTPCVCKDKNKKESSSPSMFCAPLILAPLAGGCGFFLLLLIATILYCNRIRTRRCPHHYKRKLRMMAPEKQMTN